MGSYETRGINPNAEKAQILADYFEVSVPYLLGSTNTKKEETQGFNTVEEFEKWLEYGRLLIQEQKLKEKL